MKPCVVPVALASRENVVRSDGNELVYCIKKVLSYLAEKAAQYSIVTTKKVH